MQGQWVLHACEGGVQYHLMTQSHQSAKRLAERVVISDAGRSVPTRTQQTLVSMAYDIPYPLPACIGRVITQRYAPVPDGCGLIHWLVIVRVSLRAA